MANVTGTIGTDAVDLQNMATEDTLQKLLDEMKKVNQSIIRTGSSGGGGGASSALGAAASAATALSTGFNGLSLITGAIRGAFNILSSVISGVAGVLGGMTKGFIQLASKAMDGNARISDFYNALSNVTAQIPIFGGALSSIVGLFEKLARFQEANLDSYIRLTSVGVNFAGDLTRMRVAAADSYLTLGEFSSVLSKNSKTFAMLGSTVNGGAEAFVKMASSLVRSDAGKYLMNLGYTAEQVNNGLAGYLATTGGRNAAEMKNSKAITESSAAYLEQLDSLARITGEERSVKAEELKQQASNAAFQAKLQGMSEAEKAKATQGLALALATGGKGAADAFQAEIMGVAPTTKAAQQYTAMYGEAAAGIRQSANMVSDSTKSRQDMERQMLNTQDTQLRESKKYGDQLKYATTSIGGAVGDTFQAIETTNNRTRQQTREDREAAFAKKNLQASEAAAMIAGERALKDLGSAIWNGLSPIIQILTPIMATLATTVTKVMSGMVEEFSPTIKKATDWLKDFMEKLKNAGGGVSGFISTFAKGAVEGLSNVWEAVRPAMIELWQSVKPMLASAVAGILDFVIAALRKNSRIARFLFNETDLEKEEKEKIQADPVYQQMLANEKARLESENAQALATGGPEAASFLRSVDEDKLMAEFTKTKTRRDTGSLGKTGNLFENFGAGKDVELHGTESVLTPDQMAKLVTNAVTANQNNNLQASIQQLNSLTKEMLTVMRESSENIKRNVTATKSLNRNLFPT
jgi:hypothetical protein